MIIFSSHYRHYHHYHRHHLPHNRHTIATTYHTLATSYIWVQSAADVHFIRGILGTEGKNIKIISKIENQEVTAKSACNRHVSVYPPCQRVTAMSACNRHVNV